MIKLKRLIKAIKDYYQFGKAGDIAFLKIELLHMIGNRELLNRLKSVAGYFPTIDLEKLSKLPKGTLGYEYAKHMKKNNIQPLKISSDLLEAAKQNPFALRFIATHDIFHVLLDFDTTYAGEIGIAGFIMGQNYSKFFNIYEPIVKYIYPLIFRSQAGKIHTNFIKGKTMGKQSKPFLLAYRFEDNWESLIKDVRAEVGLILSPREQNKTKMITSMKDNKIQDMLKI